LTWLRKPEIQSLDQTLQTRMGTSVAKYADFWNAKSVLQKLLLEPSGWHCVADSRQSHHIIKIAYLCGNVDLTRAWGSKVAAGWLYSICPVAVIFLNMSSWILPRFLLD
jgi:hypothetical protein